MILRKVLGILVAVIAFGTTLGPLQALAVTHRLKSASEVDYPPLAVVQPDGAAGGFSVDLLKAVVSQARLDIHFETGHWHILKKRLIAGELDVLPLVSYSLEREKVLDFTIPYLRLHGTIFIRKGEEGIRSKTDLKNREVVVMRGDTAHEYAIRHQLAGRLVLTDTYAQAVQQLSSGQHDALLIQHLVGLQLIRQLGIDNLVSLDDFQAESLKPGARPLAGFEQKFCFAVPEGRPALLARLNEGLSIVFEDGTYHHLYEKWFRPILPKKRPNRALILKYMLIILVPVVLIMGLSGLWLLKRKVTSQTQALTTQIQERIRSENELRESREMLQNFLDAVPQAAFLIDRQAVFLKANREVARRLKQDIRTIIGTCLYDYLPEEVSRNRKGYINKAFETGIPQQFEDIRQNTHIETYVEPIRDDSGTVCQAAVLGVDITKRKEAESRLRQSEQKLRFILDSLPEMVLEVDRNMTILWANKVALDLNPKAIGQPCYRAFPGKDRECEGCYCRKAFETGNIEMGIMYQPSSATSGESYWENLGVPLKDSDGRISTVLEISRDVTDREKALKREKRLQKDLLQAQKMESIGTLAGGIAHDFNNILTSILGYCALSLKTVPPGSTLEEDLQEIQKAGLRAKGLVRQILAFARKSEETVKPVSPHAIAKEALKLVRASIPTTIHIQEDIRTRKQVMGNPTQIHQILMNLLTNAAQAMETDGGLLGLALTEVSGERLSLPDGQPVAPGDYIQLSISDTGPGIPDSIINTIFEPYFTTKEPTEGTGMGLAVVDGIIESLNGRIWVQSSLGTGTTFTILLPALAEECHTQEQSNRDLIGGKERILFIDDEKQIAKVGSRLLSGLGYQVHAMTASRDALQLFLKDPSAFDLVISDMTMPEMTGDDLAREMIKIRPDLRFILCTGYSKKLDRDRVLETGVRELLIKPVELDRLAETVRTVLDE